ncbi:pre-rRNA processing protein [Phlyctochytrium planicorne]|nr:pre-rRNA processing protein [Phlyctochytrium planicorne]
MDPDPFFKSTVKRKRGGGTGRKVNPLLQKTKKRDGSAITERPQNGAQERKRRHQVDEDLGGSEDDNDEAIDDMDLTRKDNVAVDQDDDEDRQESAAQKRLRMAKRYLAKISEETAEEGDIDAAEIDREIISQRLRDDVLKTKGLLFQKVAEKYSDIEARLEESEAQRDLRLSKGGHQLAITAVAVARPKHTGTSLPLSLLRPPVYIYSASKDGIIIKWNFWTGKRLHTFQKGLKPTKRAKSRLGAKRFGSTDRHSDEILCMDVSDDGRFLATGGLDKVIHIWSTEDDRHIGSFKQHRDAITGLAFRKGPINHLYSCSLDRTVKVWNVDEMTYIETLFGHQDHILAIDALALERCVTVGARDKTARLWKVVEESQLVFRGGGGANLRQDVMEGLVLPSEIAEAKKEAKRTGASSLGGSIDVVAMVDENTFLTGSDSGSISIWNTGRKKPLFTKLRAHGPAAGETDVDLHRNYITALASLAFTDLFASGSSEGSLRLWKIVDEKKSFVPHSKIPMAGFINSIKFFHVSEPATEHSNADDVYLHENAGKGELRRAIARKSEEIAKKTTEVLHIAVGLGKEHRLGRWWNESTAKNTVQLIKLG